MDMMITNADVAEAARLDAVAREEAAYAAALDALRTTPDIGVVATAHGLCRYELRLRAAFADVELLGVERHLVVARSYDLDDSDTEDLIARLLEAGHDVQVPGEAATYAN